MAPTTAPSRLRRATEAHRAGARDRARTPSDKTRSLGRNLTAAHGDELQRAGRRFKLHNPRIVDGKAAYAHLPAIVRPTLRAANFPGYALLDRQGGRRPRSLRYRQSPGDRGCFAYDRDRLTYPSFPSS